MEAPDLQIWRSESGCRLYTILVGSFAFAGSSVFLLFPISCPIFPSLTVCPAGFRPQHHIPNKQPYTGCITSIQNYIRSDSYNSFFFFLIFVHYLVALSLCRWAGFYLVAVGRLLIAEVPLVAEHKLWGPQTPVVLACGLSNCSFQTPEHRLSSCGAWA